MCTLYYIACRVHACVRYACVRARAHTLLPYIHCRRCAYASFVFCCVRWTRSRVCRGIPALEPRRPRAHMNPSRSLACSGISVLPERAATRPLSPSNERSFFLFLSFFFFSLFFAVHFTRRIAYVVKSSPRRSSQGRTQDLSMAVGWGCSLTRERFLVKCVFACLRYFFQHFINILRHYTYENLLKKSLRKPIY